MPTELLGPKGTNRTAPARKAPDNRIVKDIYIICAFTKTASGRDRPLPDFCSSLTAAVDREREAVGLLAKYIVIFQHGASPPTSRRGSGTTVAVGWQHLGCRTDARTGEGIVHHAGYFANLTFRNSCVHRERAPPAALMPPQHITVFQLLSPLPCALAPLSISHDIACMSILLCWCVDMYRSTQA